MMIFITFIFLWCIWGLMWLNAQEYFTSENTELISRFDRFCRFIILLPLWLIAEVIHWSRILITSIKLHYRSFKKYFNT